MSPAEFIRIFTHLHTNRQHKKHEKMTVPNSSARYRHRRQRYVKVMYARVKVTRATVLYVCVRNSIAVLPWNYIL